MKTLIGSTALKHWYMDARDPKDLDYLSPDPIPGADVFWHEDLEGVFKHEVASPHELYTLKVSHAYWDLGNWEKHMYDTVFLQRKGAKLVPDLYKTAYKIHKEIHRKNPTNLNQSKKDFFDDAVDRKYDHDSIHASVAYYDEPLYESILVPGEEVAVDINRFYALSMEDKYKLVREEVYATALERWLIPQNYNMSPSLAYHMAMKKTITSLFKGEWAKFIVVNYDNLSRPDINYVKRHLDNKHKLELLTETIDTSESVWSWK